MAGNISFRIGYSEADRDETLSRFWVSFKMWFEIEIPGMDILQECYEGYNEFFDIRYLSIYFDYEYKLHLGIQYSGVFETDTPVIEEVSTFIELAYGQSIKKEKRYDFTVLINKRFEKFGLPYRLQSGYLRVLHNCKITFFETENTTLRALPPLN